MCDRTGNGTILQYGAAEAHMTGDSYRVFVKGI